jgi:hypothetical protein
MVERFSVTHKKCFYYYTYSMFLPRKAFIRRYVRNTPIMKELYKITIKNIVNEIIMIKNIVCVMEKPPFRSVNITNRM